MFTLRTAASAAALVLATTVVPAVAQQNGPATQSPGTTTQQTPLSDAMVHKVGTALRHIASIRQQYAQRAQSVATPQQRQDLDQQAQQEMVKAINAEGLSLQQYDQAMQMAQADPTLRERLISVVRSGD